MRALIKDKPVRGATLTDLPMPEIGEEDLLVRVQAVAICGTDIHIYQDQRCGFFQRRSIKSPVTLKL